MYRRSNQNRSFMHILWDKTASRIRKDKLHKWATTHTTHLQVCIWVGATTGGLHWCHSDDLQLFSCRVWLFLSPLVLTLIHGTWPLWWCKPIQPKCKGSRPTWGYSRCQLHVHAFHRGLSSTTQWSIPIHQFWVQDEKKKKRQNWSWGWFATNLLNLKTLQISATVNTFFSL